MAKRGLRRDRRAIHSQLYRSMAPAAGRRVLAFELLEERALLSVAQDLHDAIAPYQASLNAALDVATSMPLVGDQLKDLQEFNTILADSLSSIAANTQNLSSGHIQLAIPLPSLAETFTFDLGLDAFLQVSTSGGVAVAINPVLNVGFNYNLESGDVDLIEAETNLDIGFHISLPNFQAAMSFNGLLFTKAVDQGTNFDGHLKFGFDSTGNVAPSFSGQANVRLGLSLSFVDPALGASFNPQFRTRLEVDWGFNTANNQMLAPSIKLVDFGLEADSLLQGVIGDIVTTVQKFTRPIQPFIDIFETPVPIMSAFDSSETIGNLFLKGAGLSEQQRDSFNFMIDVIQAVNTIDLGSTGGAVITFGTINLTGDARQAGGFNFDTTQIASVIDDIFDSPVLDELQDTLETFADYAGLNSTAGFKFDLLENPGPVIGAILTGGTESIFSYSTGRQHFELGASIGVGIEDLFGVFLGAGIIFDANLTMGYDTAGLVRVAQTHDPADLLHGFYFDNSVDTSGPPVPNVPDPRKTGLYLQGFMELKASAIVTISGGLYANVSVELASTDSSSHVHLDSMIENLVGGAKVFDLGGQIYAAATIELSLPNPVGPDITVFEYELGREVILDFDPPPSPSLGRPLTIVDVTDQHTLLLDVNKMSPGSIVSVRPFHDYVAAGTSYSGDFIRVDYPNEIVLYVERKDDVTTNYYNLIGLNGALPVGASINITDPFNVFAAEGAVNPAPSQTKPGVLLTGGKNAGYSYTEAADGSHATVLLAGGYGSSTLAGGTMMFGNFIPVDRIAQAKWHFGDISGYDGAGQSLINSAIDGVIAPASSAGVIGSKMSGGRGGLMLGGAGVNSFVATGAGVYEMIGGAWVDSFNISPSFGGVPATYAIDGGPGGGNSLVVRVPADENVTFENSTVADKYAPTFKAVAVQANAGLAATAHGITKTHIVAQSGSSVTIGDTSELNTEFSITGGVELTFGGTNAPDVFAVATTGPYHGLANHYSPHRIYVYDTTEPGVPDSTTLGDYWGAGWFPLPDPVYTVTRTFGTNGRTQAIPFAVHDARSSSIKLNAGGANDAYSLNLGLGAFIDVDVTDADTSTTNSLTITTDDGSLIYDTLNFNDNSVELDYYTKSYLWSSYTEYNTYYPWTLSYYMSSAHYSPTVTFSSNIAPTVQTVIPFHQTNINRPLGLQAGGLLVGGAYTSTLIPYFGLSIVVGIWDVSQTPWTQVNYQGVPNELDIIANGGNFVVQKTHLYYLPGTVVDIHSNTGTLSFSEVQTWDGYYDTFNVLGNAGTLNFFTSVTGTNGYGGTYVQGLTRVVNVLANLGTINLQSEVATYLINYAIESQVNIGSEGSLANVHGTINLSNSNGHYGLKIDDRTNSGASAAWVVDYNNTKIGDLTINYPGLNAPVLYFDNFSKFEAFPKSSSFVFLAQDPPFYFKSYNGGPFPGPTLSAPYSLFHIDGETVNETISATAPGGAALTFSASNLPAGLTINPTTGLISGTIAPGAWANVPYETIITVTGGQFGRAAKINWYVSSGIAITVDESNLPDFEGESVNTSISATNAFNRPVTFTITGLPPGLSLDANTSTIHGTISPGAAQSGPYTVEIHATDGAETAEYEFVWAITGIALSSPTNQVGHVGDSVHLAIQGSTVSGAPLEYTAEGLPDGLSIDANTGVISGVVAASAAETRTFYSWITATSGNDTAYLSFIWSVLPAGVANYISIFDPGLQNSREGENVYKAIYASSTFDLPLTFTVTGLPPGLEWYGSNGSAQIYGAIEPGAATASPYHIEVFATDEMWSDSITFDWIVRPSGTIEISDYGTSMSFVNQMIDDFQIYAVSSLGETLTYSATGLPPGLSIDAQTGVISGTALPVAAHPSIFQVSVTAASANDSDTTSFLWYVLAADQSTYQTNRATFPNPSGVGTFDVISPEGTTLSASISPNAGVGLPAGIEFPFGFLTFTITGLEPGQAADLTITGLEDASLLSSYYKYGATPANPTAHWYNFLLGVQTDGDNAAGTGMGVIGPDDVIVLHLIDGGRGDDDLAKNGVIFDIGGPAAVAAGPLLPGDYNLNGVVDASDYTVWRDRRGQTGLTPFSSADGNGNGTIDAGDYDVWRANFGRTVGGSGGGGSSVAVDRTVGSPVLAAAPAGSALADGEETVASAANGAAWLSTWTPSSRLIANPRPIVRPVGQGVERQQRHDLALVDWLARPAMVAEHTCTATSAALAEGSEGPASPDAYELAFGDVELGSDRLIAGAGGR